MTVAAINMLHGIYWGSTLISQISSCRNSTGINKLIAHAAGAPQPMFAANMKQQQETSFDSTQIKTLLDLTATGLANTTNADLYYRASTSLGDRVAAATTSHYQFRAAVACLMPSRLSASDSQLATMSSTLYPVYNGTDEPIVYAGSKALAGTPSNGEHYTVGPMAINGTAVGSVQEITLDFGIKLLMKSGDGDLYNTFFTVEMYQPTLTVKVLNLAPWATIGPNGLSQAATFYLRQVLATGRAADDATTGIGITVASSLLTVDDSSNGGNDPTTTTLTCQPISSDGITAPIVIDTTSDIP